MELVVALSVFAILLAGSAYILAYGFNTWAQAAAVNSVQTELKKAESSLRRDLLRTSSDELDIDAGPVSLAGADGDAVWFLSAVDPVSGDFVRNTDGTPDWQRNILYYLAVPIDHVSLHGFLCAGVASNGYEVACPHKVLVRKVIDYGVPTSPDPSPASEETLIPPGDIGVYLSRPEGNGTLPAEPGREEARLMAQGLLTFRVTEEPPSNIFIDLRGVKSDLARKAIQLGSESLLDTPYVVQFEFAVPANNAGGP